MSNLLALRVPENFSFKNTINSHGWSSLRPFEIDELNWRLSYVFRDGQKAFPATISDGGSGALRIEIAGNVQVNEEKILRDVRHILRLDDDLTEFYRLMQKEEALAWIAELNAGRLLRSPTVFEDLVKTICTTNCSWSLTVKMVTNLVERLGEPAADGRRAFPAPEAMAAMPAEFYRDEIRAGYRAPYLAELAAKVAAGGLNPESWLDSDLSTAELKKEMKKIKGVGDYAAENLLKLLGRYDGLALDSWLRAQFYKKHNGETVCSDRDIEHFYEKFGRWRGLAMWCDMTKTWLS